MDEGVKMTWRGRVMKWLLAALLLPCWAMAQSPTPTPRKTVEQVLKVLPQEQQRAIADPSAYFNYADRDARFNEVASMGMELLLANGYSVDEAKKWKEDYLARVATLEKSEATAVSLIEPQTPSSAAGDFQVGTFQSLGNVPQPTPEQ